MMRCERWWPMKPLTPRIRIFRMGSGLRRSAPSFYRHRPGETRILPGLCLPDHTDRSAAERHAACAMKRREFRRRYRRAVDLQLEDGESTPAAAMRNDGAVLCGHRWTVHGRCVGIQKLRPQDPRLAAANNGQSARIRRRDGTHEVVDRHRVLRPGDHAVFGLTRAIVRTGLEILL